MRDAFETDRQMRGHLTRAVEDVRLDVVSAAENNDAPAALAVVKRLVAILERLPHAQVLCIGDHSAQAGDGVVVPKSARQLTSKYSGRCIVCDGWYHAGEIIYWSPDDRSVTCARCSVKEWFR